MELLAGLLKCGSCLCIGQLTRLLGVEDEVFWIPSSFFQTFLNNMPSQSHYWMQNCQWLQWGHLINFRSYYIRSFQNLTVASTFGLETACKPGLLGSPTAHSRHFGYFKGKFSIFTSIHWFHSYLLSPHSNNLLGNWFSHLKKNRHCYLRI